MNATRSTRKRVFASKVSRETAVLADLAAELDNITPDVPFDWLGFIRRLAVVSSRDQSALRRKAELVMRVTEIVQPDPGTDAGCLSWLLESLAADVLAGGAE